VSDKDIRAAAEEIFEEHPAIPIIEARIHALVERDRFPILGGSGWDYTKEHYPRSYIPWWLAEEAYKSYSKKYGTDQSLKRLAERGGFGREELITLLVERERERCMNAIEEKHKAVGILYGHDVHQVLDRIRQGGE
jgi:hypothetical protein